MEPDQKRESVSGRLPPLKSSFRKGLDVFIFEIGSFLDSPFYSWSLDFSLYLSSHTEVHLNTLLNCLQLEQSEFIASKQS